MPDYMATRHGLGGQHYACVTVTDPVNPNDFARTTLEAHFQRHYTQMAMLARFEFAALLRFSSRLTQAVTDLQRNRAAGWLRRRGRRASTIFETEIERIRFDFLRFTNRYRFT